MEKQKIKYLNFFFRPKAIKASKQIQIFNNINDDKRFKNHSLTAFFPKSTFYVESPLVSSTGHVYGYLHTIHDHFHDLSNQQKKELKKLTQLCGSLFEKGKALLKKENLLALQNQENKILHQVQNMNKLGRWELDLKTNDLSWSKEVYDIHELPLNTDITKTKGINFYHPSFKDQLHNALENCIINGEAFQIECLLITHKNNHKWVRSTGWKVDNKVTGSFQDITEVKERELKFKGIFNSTFAF